MFIDTIAGKSLWSFYYCTDRGSLITLAVDVFRGISFPYVQEEEMFLLILWNSLWNV